MSTFWELLMIVMNIIKHGSDLSEEMYTYLQQRFYRNNHAKYRKYFDEMIKKLKDYFEQKNNE